MSRKKAVPANKGQAYEDELRAMAGLLPRRAPPSPTEINRTNREFWEVKALRERVAENPHLSADERAALLEYGAANLRSTLRREWEAEDALNLVQRQRVQREQARQKAVEARKAKGQQTRNRVKKAKAASALRISDRHLRRLKKEK